MSSVAIKRMTVAEYFAYESTSEYKTEFFNGHITTMHRSSVTHNQINTNLSAHVGMQLKDTCCQSLSMRMRILVEQTGLYTYPDVLIVCGELQFDPANDETITNPQVIFEILSDSTERYDRTTKFRNYQQIPSLQEYILVSQYEAACERFVRQADGTWALRAFVGRDSTLELTTVDVKVKLADIYANTVLPRGNHPWLEPDLRTEEDVVRDEVAF